MVVPRVTFDGGKTTHEVAPPSRPGRQAYPGAAANHNAHLYLQGRRAAETGDSRLWRVHGALYDLDASEESRGRRA